MSFQQFNSEAMSHDKEEQTERSSLTDEKPSEIQDILNKPRDKQMHQVIARVRAASISTTSSYCIIIDIITIIITLLILFPK
jgi:hypothetical protein